MENEEPEKVVLPMQPMAIEVLSEGGYEETGYTEIEQDRLEEEQENEERGMD